MYILKKKKNTDRKLSYIVNTYDCKNLNNFLL